MIEFIIDEEYETVRIDRFLRKHLKNIALFEIYKMLRKAKIKVNNKKVSQDYRLVLGDIIFVFLPESFEEKNEEAFIELNEIRKEKLKSMIAYENERKTNIKEVIKQNPNVEKIGIIIGPEGGMSMEEVKSLEERGAKTVGLGKRILRTETAPITMISMLIYEYEF